MKHQHPFRIGATSYVLPADITTNVRFLAPLVDDIELVLFESGEISPLPDGKIIQELARIAGDYSITYTVHLPLDISLGDPNPAIRQNSIRKCRQGIEVTRELKPFAYVLHCNSYDQAGPDDTWIRNIGESVDILLENGMEPHLLCIENLDYPFSFIERISETSGTSICCDLGHLVLNEPALLANPERLLRRTRVVHLHGIVDTADHKAVAKSDCHAYAAVLSTLLNGASERVATIEVFDRYYLEQSLATIKEFALCQK